MRVLYWAKLSFAQRQLVEALSALPIELTIARSFDEVILGLSATDMLVATDCAPDQAAILAPAIAQSPIRWFQFLSAGRDRLSAVGLPPHLELFSPEDALAPAVTEHGMALALGLYRGLPHAITAAAAHDWEWGRARTLRAMEGDTALIVGLGAIGRDFARRAAAFGMNVLAVTRSPQPDPQCVSVHALGELDGLLPQAGLVFVSIALVPGTRHLIGARQLGLMRNDAFVINVARGGVIDQVALVAALQTGRIGGAGLDVTDPEPLPAGDPLWTAPNLLLTPHVAAMGSWRSEERLAAIVARNVSAALKQAQRRP